MLSKNKIRFINIILIPISIISLIVFLIYFKIIIPQNYITLIIVFIVIIILWFYFKKLERVFNKNQEELIKSKNRFKDIANNMADWIWEVDKKGVYTYVSKNVEQILGYTQKEIIGSKVTSFMKKKEADNIDKIFGQFAKARKPFKDLINWSLRKDGKLICLLTSGTPIFDINNQIIGYRGINTEITEKVEKEKEINLLRRSVEQSIDGFAVSDMNGNVNIINKAWAEMHGGSKEDYINKPLTIFHSQEQLKNEVAPFNEIVIKNGYNNGEIFHKRKDGSVFPTWMSVTALLDSNNKPDALVAICRDITEQKKLEIELLYSKNKAEEANIAKSEFLANMSHEIRTPMNGVMGMTELLLDTELDPEQKDYALTVKRSAENLLSIINDILDFSKIEAGKLDIEYIEFNLISLTNDIERIFSPKAIEKNLDFIINIDKNIPEKLIGDPGRIKQILINLLGNAFKFTKTGKIDLEILIEKLTNKNELLLKFSVVDTGTGIKKENISKLFDSFTQADTSTTRKFGGTGLGLAISKQLTDLMGGTLNANSIIDEGSTFYFTLKFKIKKTKIVPLIQKNLHNVKDKTILIIANDETNMIILGKMLSSWGFNFKKATSAESALKILQEASKQNNPFSIAIIDMNSPEMTGEDLGIKIKNDNKTKDTILIMITSTAKRGDGARLLKIGFEAYLPKPVRQSELYDCLIMVTSKDEQNKFDKNNKLITKYTIAELRETTKKILLVEDNVINQKFALKLLTKMGFKIEIATNGKEGVDAVNKDDYDLVLMDVQMPIMNGYEATKEIRKIKHKKKSNIPIIAMTANAMDGDREKCLEAGMNDYVSKPIKPLTLKDVILRNIG